jgi:hypothetical protein
LFTASPLRLTVHLGTKQAKTQTLTTRTITITELHDRDAWGRGAAREMRDQGKRGARRAKDTDTGTGPGRQSETRGRVRGVGVGVERWMCDAWVDEAEGRGEEGEGECRVGHVIFDSMYLQTRRYPSNPRNL